MDRASLWQERGEERENKKQELKLCLPLAKFRSSTNANPFSLLRFWVSKSLRGLPCRVRLHNGFVLRRSLYSGFAVKETGFCGPAGFIEAEEARMEERLVDKSQITEESKDGFDANVVESESFVDSIEEECRESSSSSDTSTSDGTTNEERSNDSSEASSSTSPLGWSIGKVEVQICSVSDVTESKEKTHSEDKKLEKQLPVISEVELMKERFSKLLLGEDMSGCGKGVCTALAISNAITNLCATLFGQLWRLEPLPSGKKSMWRREMNWLLCVSDHIVEFAPSCQTFPDGSKLEVMTCRPRSDIYINLPALRKLDNMLLEILDSFSNTEFWYVDQGIFTPDADGSASFRRPLQRQEEKWWLPVPRVPPCGLQENSRKQLQHKRECTNQILKAAMAINSIALAEMEIPESYLDALPKNGRASLGDMIHRYVTSDQFSPECLLDCLDLSSEHQALEIANRFEASTYVWRRRTNSRTMVTTSRSTSKSSWDMVKELMVDVDKRELFADRAESLLLCLKQRFPGLPQTTLDMSKIQYNKDVGKSILESYSRVLESLAFNIVARIDDLLYVDDLTKHSDEYSSIPTVSVIAHKRVSIPYSVPVSSTPYATAFTTPSFSPAPLVSPARVGRSPFVNGNKRHFRGFGVKKVLTDYLGMDLKGKSSSNSIAGSDTNSSSTQETPESWSSMGNLKIHRGVISPPTQD